jgi:hypothetical protein
MTTQETLVAGLKYYSIEIISVNNNKVTVGRGYSIEVETNGLYKLFSDGLVVAPFDDVDELCRFILL